MMHPLLVGERGDMDWDERDAPPLKEGRGERDAPHSAMWARYRGWAKQAVKRIIDLSGAVVALVLFAVPAAVIAAATWMDLGRPVLFRQKRPGMRGRPFVMCKFRTMRDTYDEQGRLLPDEQRLTRLGRWLRATSLDELPEFWNVLKGDMSLVGPRPLRMEYLDRYTEEQARRHSVRPGITGWAQIHGRNLLSWEEKFRLDVWYVDHWTIWLDFKILFTTVLKVLSREGISARDHATMPEFMGTFERTERSDPR